VRAGRRDLTDGEQPRDRGAPVEVGGDATARVVRCGPHRHRLTHGVEAGSSARTDDGRKARGEVLDTPTVEEQGCIARFGQSACHRAGDDVARGEVREGVHTREHRPARGVADDRAGAAQRLGEQGPLARRTGLEEHRRVELHELEMAQGRPRTRREREPVSGRLGGIGRRRVRLPEPTGREDDRVRRDLDDLTHGTDRIEIGDDHAGDGAGRSGDEVERDAALLDANRSVGELVAQSADHLRPGRVPARVDDACLAVATFAPEGELAGHRVESGTPGLEALDHRSGRSGEIVHDRDIAQPSTGNDGVGCVRSRSVGGTDRCGDAALCPPARAFAERGLRHEIDLPPGLGGDEGGDHTGSSAADNDDVGGAPPRRRSGTDEPDDGRHHSPCPGEPMATIASTARRALSRTTASRWTSVVPVRSDWSRTSGVVIFM
jgi:hypothetical protein